MRQLQRVAAQQRQPASEPLREGATPTPDASHTGQALLQLQRTRGNRYVQGVVNAAREVNRPAPAPIIQTKLVLGAPDDKYEREADHVARQVANDATRSTGAPPSIQRRLATPNGSVAVEPGVQQAIQGARGDGQPLPAAARSSMERALGANFGAVRVHTNAQADALNQSLQAHAFTTGNDIFFRRGGYDLGSRNGRELLTHELTHVVQQGMNTANVGANSPASLSDTAGVIQRGKRKRKEDDEESDESIMEKETNETDQTAAPPPRKRYRQTHFVARPTTTKNLPTWVPGEIHDYDFGVKVPRGSKGSFTPKYREKQINWPKGHGGAGLDEEVSTEAVWQMIGDLKGDKFSDQEIKQFVGRASQYRGPVNNLMWPVEGGKYSGWLRPQDTQQKSKAKKGVSETVVSPFGGHPGSISSGANQSKGALTEGHAFKDVYRREFVLNEFNKTPTAQKVTPETSERLGAIGGIFTVNEMMSPYATLMASSPSNYQGKFVKHSKHGSLIDEDEAGQKQWNENFVKLATDVHNARERKKFELAHWLVKQGYGNLLPDELVQAASPHSSWEEAWEAHSGQTQPGQIDQGPAQSEAWLPREAKTLDELKQANQKAVAEIATIEAQEAADEELMDLGEDYIPIQRPRLYRALSKPRSLVGPKFKRRNT